MTINDKSGVVTLLELLENVSRQVKDLPEFVKQGIALNAACLTTDLDELESLVRQAIDVVNDQLHDGEGYYQESELSTYGYIHESDINCSDNFEPVLDALKNLHRADSDDQERLILEVLKRQDTITDATHLSAILHKTDLNFRCVENDTLESVLTLLRNPFNAELADKLQGETNEIPF